ncbi:hypothetical protein ACFRMQ_02860 [Kitasatospora sp. NPDC056783]|uniref:hypothetical protein n=1 Tax=Kitasatospora sp. NPDC056783 TaxID=3345943 RepID=UPI0036A8114C
MSVRVLLCVVLVGVLAVVCVVAMVIHGLLARIAMSRARPEDLPRLLADSGKTLTGLFGFFSRRVPLPRDASVGPVGQASATEEEGEAR